MPVIPAVNFSDPRLKVGAYIADAVDLYEVTGVSRSASVMGVGTYRIVLENSRSLQSLEFLPSRIRERFELVRAAPAPAVPDTADGISWGSA